ncbi:DUF502 domain-containing protein [Halapricum hydrolyticum]|uniref:DUF502 domain-containing protein n=1 Tax=Halapricum hydrolyticum TaxID=2979991 RepID=A0AAE3LHR0_9EURY|nr:DUF502 domain-containing protein [Halapricum hydrolyticum]MCU4716932.1 DUF502 domain-containing protein [Halapricum hydrolyticum]MCU4725463.1 DUF502 domain-containing protein [Halapricum hydrolyticum]
MNWKRWLRNSFVTGLILVAPLIVTLVALRFALGWLTGFVEPVVSATDLARFTGEIEFLARLLAVLIMLALIGFVGFLAQWGIASRLFGSLDRVIGFIPMVRVIYTGVQGVANSLVEPTDRYESVVLVEYPRDNVYALGFVTAESPEPVQTAIGEAYNVYLPNSPNPTNGHLALVPESEVHELDISVRRGIRLMVTTGIAETKDELEALDADISDAVETATTGGKASEATADEASEK